MQLTHRIINYLLIIVIFLIVSCDKKEGHHDYNISGVWILSTTSGDTKTFEFNVSSDSSIHSLEFFNDGLVIEITNQYCSSDTVFKSYHGFYEIIDNVLNVTHDFTTGRYTKSYKIIESSDYILKLRFLESHLSTGTDSLYNKIWVKLESLGNGDYLYQLSDQLSDEHSSLQISLDGSLIETNPIWFCDYTMNEYFNFNGEAESLGSNIISTISSNNDYQYLKQIQLMEISDSTLIARDISTDYIHYDGGATFPVIGYWTQYKMEGDLFWYIKRDQFYSDISGLYFQENCEFTRQVAPPWRQTPTTSETYEGEWFWWADSVIYWQSTVVSYEEYYRRLHYIEYFDDDTMKVRIVEF